MPIFIKSVVGLLFCFVIGIFLINRANKPKAEFQKLTGKITYLLNKLPNEEVTNDDKERYCNLKIVIGYLTSLFERTGTISYQSLK